MSHLLRRCSLLAGLPLLAALTGCAPSVDHDPHHAAAVDHDPHHAVDHDPHHAHAAPAGPDAALDEVARIHGAAGPWAVAGYRMGHYALARLGLPRQSFDLEVVHRSPRAVQFSCIADGASAATGASLGKLNLSLTDADAAHVETTYRRKSTGATITLRPTAAFRARFLDVPPAQIPEAGRAVLGLTDAEIFEEVRAH